jgi:glycine/D-amino acid oxidase-like deaminating enzyme
VVNRLACYKHPVNLPGETTVAIIGGGFAGVATAWALARAGIDDVVVLEREREIGRYASGRGAGIGRQLADDDDTTALTVRGAAMLRDDLAAAWTPCGGVLSFDDTARADVYLARARRFGVAIERIDRDAVVARWPAARTLAVATGLWVPSDGVIDVRALLAIYAERARIVTDAPVLAVSSGRHGARIGTPRGELTARIVVDAAGAWAGRLTGGDPLATFKRHLAVLELAAPGAAYWWHLGASEVYARRDAGGVLASPCDEALSSADDLHADPRGLGQLRALVGDFATAPVVREWACVRSFTADRRMRLGRDVERPWLVWAAGLGGHGATASAAVGETVARAVASALTA